MTNFISSHSRAFIAHVLPTLILVGAIIAGDDAVAAPQVNPPPTAVCNSSGSGSQPGSTPTTPGAWWNPRKDGTGWQLMYLADNQTLSVAWFTYNAQGRPTWLLSRTESVNSVAGTWQAELLKYTWSFGSGNDLGGPNAGVRVGSVAISFLPNDPLRAAIRWQWDEAGQTAHTECIRDYGHGEGISPSSGVNAAFSGAWFEPQMSGYGIALNVALVPVSGAPTQYLETTALTTYDDSGQPVWLMGSGGMRATVPLLGLWESHSLSMNVAAR